MSPGEEVVLLRMRSKQNRTDPMEFRRAIPSEEDLSNPSRDKSHRAHSLRINSARSITSHAPPGLGSRLFLNLLRRSLRQRLLEAHPSSSEKRLNLASDPLAQCIASQPTTRDNSTGRARAKFTVDSPTQGGLTAPCKSTSPPDPSEDDSLRSVESSADRVRPTP